MALAEIQSFIQLIPAIKEVPEHTLWLTYDQEADTLYINFKKPSYATDSEMTEDDVIIRYEGDSVVGMTVLHAGTRV